jgi:outer membrane receptor protein involved in Fe transport
LEGLPGSNGDIGSDGSWATTQTIRYVNAQDFYPEAVDTGKLIQMDSNSWAQTVHIDSSYLSLTAGQRIDFVRTGTNNSNTVTFSATGVTLNGTPGLKLRARYSAATLVCLSSNNYILVGDLSA